MDSRHRSGSFTALNSPSFGPIMHAQSMAQLNCPSCHHHGMVWDWNQSHMTSGGFAPAWGGLPTGTWHGSAMLPPYRPEPEMARRNSLRAPPRRSRRDLTTDDEEDATLQRRRNTSPVRSRRGPMSDESDDEVMSHRGSRRHRRRNSPVSRNASPTLSRRGSRKKSSVGVEELIARRVKQNEEEALRSRRFDDETMSNRGSRRYDDETGSNRGGRRYDDEVMSNRGGRRYDDETMSNRGGRRFDDERLSMKSGRRQELDEPVSQRGNRRSDFEDSMSSRSQKFDDDVISNRGGRRNDLDETLSNRGNQRVADSRRRRRSSPNQTRTSPAMSRKYSKNASSEDSGDEMSDGMKNSLSVSNQSKREEINNEISTENSEQTDVIFPEDVDKPLGPVPTEEWECDHCTFVNQAGSRVCMVCCKTTNNPKYKQQNKPQRKQQLTTETRSPEINAPKKMRQDSSTSPLKENIALSDKKEELNLKEEVQVKPLTRKFTNQDNLDNGDLSERLKKQLAIPPSPPEKKKGRQRRTISFWLGSKLYS
uniref:RanBP2-type domain-containing protein n=2 Tax=Graphocephala atropunctata TaxID=36148 RepID=A0A1B6M541_9HEMI